MVGMGSETVKGQPEISEVSAAKLPLPFEKGHGGGCREEGSPTCRSRGKHCVRPGEQAGLGAEQVAALRGQVVRVQAENKRTSAREAELPVARGAGGALPHTLPGTRRLLQRGGLQNSPGVPVCCSLGCSLG